MLIWAPPLLQVWYVLIVLCRLDSSDAPPPVENAFKLVALRIIYCNILNRIIGVLESGLSFTDFNWPGLKLYHGWRTAQTRDSFTNIWVRSSSWSELYDLSPSTIWNFCPKSSQTIFSYCSGLLAEINLAKNRRLISGSGLREMSEPGTISNSISHPDTRPNRRPPSTETSTMRGRSSRRSWRRRNPGRWVMSSGLRSACPPILTRSHFFIVILLWYYPKYKRICPNLMWLIEGRTVYI